MISPQSLFEKPLRLGLVGLNFGRQIAEALQLNSGPVVLAKVCDQDAGRARAVGEALGVPVSPSLDALLADPDIDVIGLYTGPNGRAKLLQRIIRAGKDVMTTKPFETDADAALAVLHEAHSLGRVIHLNSPNARPYGEAAIIKEWLDAGAIGQPTLAHASAWAYYGKTPADGSWYDDSRLCPLAPVFRLGIYPLNVLLTVFQDPVAVQVMHSRVETQRPTPDNAALTIRFRDGALVNIMASFVVGGVDTYKNCLTIAGTKGVIYFATGPKPRPGEPPTPVVLSTAAGIEARIPVGHAGDYDWEFFARRVRGEEPADITRPEDIVAAIRVVNAMAESERTGESVEMEA